MVAEPWRPAGRERVLPGTASQLPKPPWWGVSEGRGQGCRIAPGQLSQDSGRHV